MIDALVWLGVINAAFLGPFLVGVVGRRLTSGGATLAAGFALALGYAAYARYSPFYGVIVSGACSILACGALEFLWGARGRS